MDRDLALPALVLLDEVGAGTDPVEGGALGTAVIDHFRARGAHLIATTHYDALKSYASTTPDVVGYGDIHGTYLAADDGLMLFNAGAVGNHLDGPSAPYVILEGVMGSLAPESFSVNFVRVPYDIEAEVALARELGMPDIDAYALELREGIYRGTATPAS